MIHFNALQYFSPFTPDTTSYNSIHDKRHQNQMLAFFKKNFTVPAHKSKKIKNWEKKETPKIMLSDIIALKKKKKNHLV